MDMKYRSEIDGLRALAVIPVVLYHAGFNGFKGGFFGVDVFFVISGYLITSIILSDKKCGIFSLTNFYERRARRILPALFFMIAATIPFAWLFMRPDYFKQFSRSLGAVVIFSSNFLFWSENGYFTPDGATKPLLHTWSLAIEEQFYFLLPLFLLATWRYRKRSIVSILTLIGIASFAATQWTMVFNPEAGFYLLPTRGWELLIGVLTAFYLFDRTTQNNPVPIAGNLLAVVGTLMIVIPMLYFDQNVHHPGPATLLPTIGTAIFIIFATKTSVIGQLMSNRILASIGLCSYSLYLWHQPIFVFANNILLKTPSTYTRLSLAALSLIVGYLSWKFVETPFRDRKRLSRKSIAVFAVSTSALLLLVSVYSENKQGFPGRRVNEQQTFGHLVQKVRINQGLSPKCDGRFDDPKCRTSYDADTLIWGDSYAMHLVDGILASKPDAKIAQMTKSVCGPVLDLAPIVGGNYNTTWAEECINFNNMVKKWIIESKSIKYVVLSSKFSQYTKKGSPFLLANGKMSRDTSIFHDQFLKTLAFLRERSLFPVVFSPPPESGSNIGECLIKSQLFTNGSHTCDFKQNSYQGLPKHVFDFLTFLSKSTPVVWLPDELCRDGTCLTRSHDTFIYRDDGHLSHEGSKLIGQKMGFYQIITGLPHKG